MLFRSDGTEISFERLDDQASTYSHPVIRGSFTSKNQSTFHLDPYRHEAYLQFQNEPLIGFHVDGGGGFRYPHVDLFESLPKVDGVVLGTVSVEECRKLHEEALAESLIVQMGEKNYRSYCDQLQSLGKWHLTKYFQGIDKLIGIIQFNDLDQVFSRLKRFGSRFELQPQAKIAEIDDENFFTKTFKVTLILPGEHGRSETEPTFFISQYWGEEYKGDCKMTVHTEDDSDLAILASIEYNAVEFSPDREQRKDIKLEASLLKNGELVDRGGKLADEQKQILQEYIEVFFDSLVLFGEYDLDEHLEEIVPAKRMVKH